MMNIITGNLDATSGKVLWNGKNVLRKMCIRDSIEYSYRKKKTNREEFLEIMEEIIPWDEWVGVIEPYYPKGKRGRRMFNR